MLNCQKTAYATPNVNITILILLALCPLVGMGIDLIAPALPAISHSLKVSSTFSKNLITSYLIGLALGNLIIGFLSDSLGRHRLLLSGLFIFILSSIWPIIFPYSFSLILARFCQGLALASITVLTRAILSDILPQEKLLRVTPLLATMWGIGPIFGPMIGGYLQHYINWQACFYFFSSYGVLAFISVFFLMNETHLSTNKLNINQIKINITEVMKNKYFMIMVSLMGISYSLLIVFNTLAPFLIQNKLHYSSVFYGYIAFFTGIVFLFGTLVCKSIIKKYPAEKIFSFMPYILFLSFIIISLGFLLPSIVEVILSSMFAFFYCGIFYPIAMGSGFILFKHIAGTASAIMSFINILITSIMALLLSFINISNAWQLSCIYLILILLFSFCYWSLNYGRSRDIDFI